ncbi:MAG: Fic family protein, partial [Chitinophagia bacterium]|nr:Fic family protein [Chitinophagia bacterium]
MSLSREYPHLAFNEPLQLTHSDYYVLGQCDALIQAIKQTPILPSYYQQLMSVTLIKGGQATTAIEGNTLTIEEIERILKGEKLPPSKEYQEKEVKNILDAFTQLLKEVIIEDKWQLVTPELLLKLHKMVGNSLGEYFEAIPGKFRERDVTVGNYRCPDHSDV